MSNIDHKMCLWFVLMKGSLSTGLLLPTTSKNVNVTEKCHTYTIIYLTIIIMNRFVTVVTMITVKVTGGHSHTGLDTVI